MEPEIDHVYGVVRRFSAQDYGVLKRGCGRHCKLSDGEKRAVLRRIAVSPCIPISSLAREVCPYVSDTTLRSFLKREKEAPACPRPGPSLTAVNVEGEGGGCWLVGLMMYDGTTDVVRPGI